MRAITKSVFRLNARNMIMPSVGAVNPQSLIRSLSSVSDKLHGEEERFFRRMDEEAKLQMRLKLEAILASSDAEKHAEVLELLGTPFWLP